MRFVPMWPRPEVLAVRKLVEPIARVDLERERPVDGAFDRSRPSGPGRWPKFRVSLPSLGSCRAHRPGSATASSSERGPRRPGVAGVMSSGNVTDDMWVDYVSCHDHRRRTDPALSRNLKNAF